jgi:tetratricopeptide (TPR) repeat protein
MRSIYAASILLLVLMTSAQSQLTVDEWINKSNALNYQGKYDEAILACDRAIKINPQNADARTAKGTALFGQGKYDEAIAAYDEAIRLDPKFAKAWNNMGVTLLFQKKYGEAIKAFDETIRLNPNDAEARNNKGSALADQGKYDESIQAYSRDGTSAKKGNEYHFGYKLHQKTDIDYYLIREIETTTAKLHDSQVDLSAEGEIVLRDRGYFGVQARGIDFTMKRRTTEKPLEELDRERNRLISVLRSPGERPHAVIKRVFGAGRVLVTTVKRVGVLMMVTAFAFNLYQLCTLKNARII